MSDTLAIDELVEILEQSHCHRDAIRYVKRAFSQGGTGVYYSWAYQLNYVTVEELMARATDIEDSLLRDGAAGALEHGNLDVTNTEICESIMEDYHR